MANPTQIYSRDTKWRKGVIRTLVSELFLHGRLTTTLTRAKELRRHAEKLITKAKNPTLANRRIAASFLRTIVNNESKKDVLKILFEEIAPSYMNRNGGYTRIYKLVSRAGDNAPMAIIELVKGEKVKTSKMEKTSKDNDTKISTPKTSKSKKDAKVTK
ncbi:50S ribosomal protein L17 [Mycoplasmopsis caviae]|uniref:Large ribosomal subunit protein bL17 n=1 Tax=Mycoplasmopsis caviae TaxID=55603 RepID=A0A3P8MF54_9BACT|nr:50S ribosomal protein L17 [Mycoplasmopsis caviae]